MSIKESYEGTVKRKVVLTKTMSDILQEQLRYAFSKYNGGTEMQISRLINIRLNIMTMSNLDEAFNNHFTPLLDLPVHDYISCLINGYEVSYSPEERLIEKLKQEKVDCETDAEKESFDIAIEHVQEIFKMSPLYKV